MKGGGGSAAAPRGAPAGGVSFARLAGGCSAALSSFALAAGSGFSASSGFSAAALRLPPFAAGLDGSGLHHGGTGRAPTSWTGVEAMA